MKYKNKFNINEMTQDLRTSTQSAKLQRPHMTTLLVLSSLYGAVQAQLEIPYKLVDG